MADFPNQVNLYAGKGIPGGDASINPVLSAPFNYLAKANVNIGSFVWDNGDGTVSGTTSTNTAIPVGFAHLDRRYTLPTITAGASLSVPEGATVEVVTGGDFYAVAAGAVKAGHPVWVDTTSGKLYGATGSNYVQTNFRWAESAEANAVAVITTNYINGTAAAAG